MTSRIAVLNAGSSSIKFALYEAGHDGSAAVPRTGREDRRRAAPAGRQTPAARRRRARLAGGRLDHRSRDQARSLQTRARAAGRRAGDGVRPSRRAWRHAFAAPVACRRRRAGRARQRWCRWRRCTSRTISRRSRPSPPPRRTSRRSPASTRRSIAPSRTLAQAFALPRELTDAGVRRYGFHGLSYEYRQRPPARDCARASPTVASIIAHLGNGASLCAMQDGPQRREHDGLHRRRRA